MEAMYSMISALQEGAKAAGAARVADAAAAATRDAGITAQLTATMASITALTNAQSAAQSAMPLYASAASAGNEPRQKFRVAPQTQG
jgi:hypothetical protein